MLNIGGDGADKSYRYKMPRILTKVEGRGNGIKTAIPNLVDIAKALHTPPAYPTKFFGIELGAQSKFDKKTERAIVNGAHTNKDMQELLGKFINLFILCPTCGLPEINLAVKKGTIKLDCAACGHNGDISHQHKLATYIVKNPPGKKKDKEKVKKDKKDKKGKKQADEEEEQEEQVVAAVEAEVEEVSAEWFTDTSKAAQQARKMAEFTEMKADADIAAIEEILAKAKLENKAESPVTMLKIFLARGKSTVPEVTSEVRRLQMARGLDDSQKVKVLLEALLGNDLNTAHKDLAARADVLKKYTSEKGQTLVFISCLEELVGVTFTALLKRTPLIFQALYEADVLDEDAILSWAASPPESSYMVNKEVAAAVRLNAGPFVSWLKEAESDDEE